MNGYKLIKLTEGYIIVSDKEIENYYFNNHTKKIYLETHPKRLEVANKELNKKIRFKIVASTFIPELPNIDFNNLEKKFSIVDVEKLLKDEIAYWYNETGSLTSEKIIRRAFSIGLSVNKDRLYTLDELIKNFKPAFDKFINGGGAVGSNEDWIQFQNIVEWFPKYLQSLQPKTEWDIEIEEYCGDKDCALFGCQKYAGCKHENLQTPKITNNKIKILKIK